MNIYTAGIHRLHILNTDDKFTASDDGYIDLFLKNGEVYAKRNVLGQELYVQIDKDKKDNLLSKFDLNFDNSPIHGEITIFHKKIPSWIINFALKYFKEIFDSVGTECGLLLMYNKDKNDWNILVPLQINATSGHFDYFRPSATIPDTIKDNKEYVKVYNDVLNEYNKMVERGYILAGTIHSHCDFDAFHSGVDDSDESNFDGLHITIGHVNTKPSYSCRMMVSGHEIKLDIKDIASLKKESVSINKKYLKRLFARKVELINTQYLPYAYQNNSERSYPKIMGGHDYFISRPYEPTEQIAWSRYNKEASNDVEDQTFFSDFIPIDEVVIVQTKNKEQYVISSDDYELWEDEIKSFGIKIVKEKE